MSPQSEIKDVWIVSRELKGLASVGGVGVVTRELSQALARAGLGTTIVIPFYGQIGSQDLEIADTGIAFTLPMKHGLANRTRSVRIWRTTLEGCRVLLVDAECFREKQGIYVYTPNEPRPPQAEVGHGYRDYFEMNITLQKAALELVQQLGERPDVIHCHDGHCALIPALMRNIPRYREYFSKVGSGITIHNAGYGYNQETSEIALATAITELPPDVVRRAIHLDAFYPVVAGGAFAGFLNTVSENYAREILEVESEDYRTGYLGAALRERGIPLLGVTNGIDPHDYDPTDPARIGIAASFEPAAGDLAGKRQCREALIDELGAGSTQQIQVTGTLSRQPGTCLVGVISRLTGQKGIDVFIRAAGQLLEQNKNTMFVVLGEGEAHHEQRLRELAAEPRNQGRFAVAIGYDEDLATRVYAALDLFVNSAEFEPCGLTDYTASLMGAAPVVHLVGGLVKVRDGVTGYGYHEHTDKALVATLRRAVNTFHNDAASHRAIIQRAVQHIHDHCTWDAVLRNGYLPLYERAAAAAAAAS